eukprot:379184-Pyramimonas_sp.AAC.1
MEQHSHRRFHGTFADWLYIHAEFWGRFKVIGCPRKTCWDGSFALPVFRGVSMMPGRLSPA